MYRLILLLLVLFSAARATITCPVDSTCIACDGDINSALSTALTNEKRVMLQNSGTGNCTFSTQKTWDGDTQLFCESGTTLTYTGSVSPAFNGTASDSPATRMDGCDIVINNSNVDAFGIEGFSNTSTFENSKITGGRTAIFFEKSSADNSSVWVGLLADMEFVNQSSHAVRSEPGNVHLALIRPKATGCGDHCFSFDTPTYKQSNIQFVGADIQPNAGFAAVEVIGGSNTPFSFYDTSYTAAAAGDSFMTATSSTLGVNIVDLVEQASCNLILDKPGTGDDVPCDLVNNKLILARHTDGKADVSNLSAANEATYQKWWDKVYRLFDINPNYFGDWANAENVNCSGDIGSTIQAHFDGGATKVFVGTGRCSSTVKIHIPANSMFIGRGNGITSGGAGEGSWIDYTPAGVEGECGFEVDDGNGVVITGIKLGANDSDVDVLCLTDWEVNSIVSVFDTRNGDNHIVLREDGSGRTSSGGGFYSHLSFNSTDSIYFSNGSDAPTDFLVVTPDIGRGSSNHYQINGARASESAIMFVGSLQQTLTPEMFRCTGCGAGTAVFHAGTQPLNFGSSTDLFVADSDINLTAIGVMSTTLTGDPDNIIRWFIDEPPSGEDLPGTSFLRSKVDELVDPLGPSDTVADTTPPTPGNSGTITTSGVGDTGFTANWTKGTNGVTAQADLQYYGCRSTSDNISTIADCKNATQVFDWTTNINTRQLTGLSSSTTYYFNVIIRDEALNEALYTRVEETTLAPPTGGFLRIVGKKVITGKYKVSK